MPHISVLCALRSVAPSQNLYWRNQNSSTILRATLVHWWPPIDRGRVDLSWTLISSKMFPIKVPYVHFPPCSLAFAAVPLLRTIADLEIALGDSYGSFNFVFVVKTGVLSNECFSSRVYRTLFFVIQFFLPRCFALTRSYVGIHRDSLSIL